MWEIEGTGRPRVDLHEVEVLDAALAHRRLPHRVGPQRVDRLDRLAEHERRPHVVVRRPLTDRTLGDRHHHFVRHQLAGRDDHGLDLAVDGRTGRVPEHRVLVRLAQTEVREHRAFGEARSRRAQRGRDRDLLLGHERERMGDAGHVRTLRSPLE